MIEALSALALLIVAAVAVVCAGRRAPRVAGPICPVCEGEYLQRHVGGTITGYTHADGSTCIARPRKFGGIK